MGGRIIATKLKPLPHCHGLSKLRETVLIRREETLDLEKIMINVFEGQFRLHFKEKEIKDLETG